MSDEIKMRSIRHKVEENSRTIDQIVGNIVRKYSDELDGEVERIRYLLEDSDKLTDEELEIMVMRLPVIMYYGINGLEDLGIESDMAKAVKLEVYNDRYLDSDGTIQDKTHLAELETVNEQMIEVAFTRAYRKLRSKIEMAEHVYSGAKKVIDKRMRDMELHRVDRFN